MSIKKQFPSLCNLYTIYEEVPEKILDETDVDSCFHHHILDIALIDNRFVRVSKYPTKNFCFQTISVLQLDKSTEIYS